jgi:hypothetical protein
MQVLKIIIIKKVPNTMKLKTRFNDIIPQCIYISVVNRKKWFLGDKLGLRKI